MIRYVENPPNPFKKEDIQWLDEPPVASLKIYEERSKSILTENDSPDVGFRWGVNPYRGCFHACAYCYARRTHQYLDFGAGTDFETKIVAKVNAPELLREAFMKRSWCGETVAFSGVTDCYQPLESSYRLTRRCLEVCAEYRNPVAIITKGALVRRDLDLLIELSRNAKAQVFMSIAFSDDRMSKLIEPGAPRPSVRLRALKELSDAGIATGVGVAPVIPGLNDVQIHEVLKLAAAAGAKRAFMTLLRLPGEVQEVFLPRLERAFPTRYRKVVGQLREMKGGLLNRSNFGERMRGDGERWKAVEWMFEQGCRKYGLNMEDVAQVKADIGTFRRPTKQLALL